MRLVCNIFKDGSRTIRKQTDDGDLVEYLEGPPGPRKVRRVIAYVEVGFSEPEATSEIIMDALDRLKRLVSEEARHAATVK